MNTHQRIAYILTKHPKSVRSKYRAQHQEDSESSIQHSELLPLLFMLYQQAYPGEHLEGAQFKVKLIDQILDQEQDQGLIAVLHPHQPQMGFNLLTLDGGIRIRFDQPAPASNGIP